MRPRAKELSEEHLLRGWLGCFFGLLDYLYNTCAPTHAETPVKSLGKPPISAEKKVKLPPWISPTRKLQVTTYNNRSGENGGNFLFSLLTR